MNGGGRAALRDFFDGVGGLGQEQRVADPTRWYQVMVRIDEAEEARCVQVGGDQVVEARQ